MNKKFFFFCRNKWVSRLKRGPDVAFSYNYPMVMLSSWMSRFPKDGRDLRKGEDRERKLG